MLKKNVFLGQELRSVNKVGPFHRKELFAKEDTVWTLVAISAGLFSDGMWFQVSLGISSFDQNFGVLLIQLRATVKSDHAKTESIVKIGSSAARVSPQSVEYSRAARGSCLGTEIVLIGATRVSEQSICQQKQSEFV